VRRLSWFIAAGLVALGCAAGAASAMVNRSHAQASGVHLTPLSKATLGPIRADGAGVHISSRGRKDVLVTSITVDPGGSFGWHSHPGPVIVTVGRGTLSLFHATKHGCARETVTAGAGFVEGGGDVHLARNEGDAPVELNATFFARPGTQDFLVPEQPPRGCHV
jgi:quercetin dioxygenase-like cupin family protein